MIFGKTPFPGGTSVEKLAAILYKEPEKQEEVPDELTEILTRALQKEPEKRYQTAEEMIGDLKHLKQEMEFAEQLQIHVTNAPGDMEIDRSLLNFSPRIRPRRSNTR